MKKKQAVDAEKRAQLERELADAECLLEFIAIARERGYRSGWAFKKWREFGAPMLKVECEP
ncbi:MAG: hypothetical protein E6Q88_05295 [Lysobacteraceae bacterium]|nr:MAG: hypothetical protein E6Q88_05295 [Xanthomonadaceae bacterium]